MVKCCIIERGNVELFSIMCSSKLFQGQAYVASYLGHIHNLQSKLALSVCVNEHESEQQIGNLLSLSC
jgi:hypothetical protein